MSTRGLRTGPDTPLLQALTLEHLQPETPGPSSVHQWANSSPRATAALQPAWQDPAHPPAGWNKLWDTLDPATSPTHQLQDLQSPASRYLGHGSIYQ